MALRDWKQRLPCVQPFLLKRAGMGLIYFRNVFYHNRHIFKKQVLEHKGIKIVWKLSLCGLSSGLNNVRTKRLWVTLGCKLLGKKPKIKLPCH